MYLVVLFTHYRKEHCIKFLSIYPTLEEADIEARKFYDPPSKYRKKLNDVWEIMLEMKYDEYIQCKVFSEMPIFRRKRNSTRN